MKASKEPEQLFLKLAWNTDLGDPTNKQRHMGLNGLVTMHVGDCPVPDLTEQEMQMVAYAAKMELARVMRRRKKRI